MFTKDSELPDMTKIPRKQAPDTIISGCIVLEGGGFRGMYTSGVLDCLMEQGINVSCTVGVSAGALNGLNYAAGQIGRSARFNLQYRWDSRYVGVQAYRANHGIIGFDFVLDEYNRFDPLNAEVFYRQDRRFVAVATSCLTGKAEYFEKGKCRELMKAVQASASIPYVSRPVEVEGVPCLDGGCADRVPFQWAVDQGYEKILVVRTRTRDFRAEPNPRASHVAKRFYWRYPEFSQVLAETDEIYNRQCDRMEELEAQGRIFYLTPSEVPDVKVLEKDLGKLLSLYQLGYRDAQAQLPALRAYLGLSEGEKP
ncbi:MAG TPA: patatin family protein [Candidatus Faecousia excrementipullorum]|nr:patatin family protein [Candidatus Faecousia excrementipullorum]